MSAKPSGSAFYAGGSMRTHVHWSLCTAMDGSVDDVERKLERVWPASTHSTMFVVYISSMLECVRTTEDQVPTVHSLNWTCQRTDSYSTFYESIGCWWWWWWWWWWRRRHWI